MATADGIHGYPDQAPTTVSWVPPPFRALYDDNFRFLLDVALPGINFDDQDPLGSLVVRHADGSTAHISPTGQAQQRGPRRLCDDIAAIHKIWHMAREPGPDRYRLTLDPRGQTIWLDDGRKWHWVL